MDDEKYMRRALELARKAASEDETPIGAVIVYRDQIIGEGYNRRNQTGNPIARTAQQPAETLCGAGTR